MSYLFLWYPKCSTCQKAKKWLDENGIDYIARDIKEDRPTAAEIELWQAKSELPLKRFFNTSGLLYKDLKLKEKLPAMEAKEQFALLATDGMLVKRPLLIGEKQVFAGFKPKEWEALK